MQSVRTTPKQPPDPTNPYSRCLCHLRPLSKEMHGCSPATARPPVQSGMTGQELRGLSQQDESERGSIPKVAGSAPRKKEGHDPFRQDGSQGAT